MTLENLTVWRIHFVGDARGRTSTSASFGIDICHILRIQSFKTATKVRFRLKSPTENDSIEHVNTKITDEIILLSKLA